MPLFDLPAKELPVPIDGDEVTQAAGAKLLAKKGLEQAFPHDYNHPDLQPFQGVEPGSPEAKLLVKKVIPAIKAKGHFLDGDLQPGAHQGDKDFDLLVLKVYMQTGNLEMAHRVAGKVQQNLYGG